LAQSKYPASRVELTETLHGVELTLIVGSKIKSVPDSNLDRCSATLRIVVAAIAGREAMKQRLSELLRTDIWRPYRRNGLYFSQTEGGQDLAVIYFRKGLQGQDEVLIDPHSLSADHTTSTDLLDVSQDGTLVAYGIRRGGADEIEIHFLRVATRQQLPDELPRARYSGISIHPNNQDIYYSRFGPEGPRVYLHSVGKPLGSDVEIFGKGYGPEKIIGLSLSEDGHYLIATIHYGSAGKKTEIYARDLQRKQRIPIVTDIDARFPTDIAQSLLPANQLKLHHGF
jgi:prolyl oligopeptidase